jgi:hypothetical protein
VPGLLKKEIAVADDFARGASRPTLGFERPTRARRKLNGIFRALLFAMLGQSQLDEAIDQRLLFSSFGSSSRANLATSTRNSSVTLSLPPGSASARDKRNNGLSSGTAALQLHHNRYNAV